VGCSGTLEHLIHPGPEAEELVITTRLWVLSDHYQSLVAYCTWTASAMSAPASSQQRPPVGQGYQRQRGDPHTGRLVSIHVARIGLQKLRGQTGER
jgi:hypothetical protein